MISQIELVFMIVIFGGVITGFGIARDIVLYYIMECTTEITMKKKERKTFFRKE